MAQFEVLHEGVYYPAMRYDSAHGTVHRDILDWKGETVRKELHPAKPFGVAFTEAKIEIEQRWRQMRDAFYRRKR